MARGDADKAAHSPIYLDNAATSFPKPECVYTAVDGWLRGSGSAFGRGSHAGTDDAVRMVAQCRQRLARLLDISSGDRLAFTFNCTDGLNLLLRGFLRERDRVVTTVLEHNSVLRPLEQLKQELSLDVVRVGMDLASGQTDLNLWRQELKRQPTQLVVINHASNVTGVVQPVVDMAQSARDAGACVLLDAAQTLGHLPFRVQELPIDFLAAAGHKGLLGPLGTGVVYVATGMEQRLRPVRSGGTGTDSDSLMQPAMMPTLLESGNLNLPGLAGLNAAAEWLRNISVDAIYHHSQQLRTQLLEGLTAVPRVTVVGADDPSSSNVGIVSFMIQGLDSRDAAAILDESFGIRCRAGLHCAPLVHREMKTAASGGTLRFSPGHFTTTDDIQLAVNAVHQIAAAF
jgi:cysteine desulfurase family protein